MSAQVQLAQADSQDAVVAFREVTVSFDEAPY